MELVVERQSITLIATDRMKTATPERFAKLSMPASCRFSQIDGGFC
jgi:hypothetical protein